MDKQDVGGIALITFLGLLGIGAIGMAIAQPYFEAKTFNECTGSDATYWDALFAELRVMDCDGGGD